LPVLNKLVAARFDCVFDASALGLVQPATANTQQATNSNARAVTTMAAVPPPVIY
jgi:hypothetical protein